MPLKVKANLTGLNRRFSEARLIDARKVAANDAQQAMEKYVPRLHGDLRKESFVSHDGSHIVYSVPYARAQFYGMIGGSRIHNYTTPRTSRRWDLRLKGNSQDMAKVKEAFIKELKRNG